MSDYDEEQDITQTYEYKNRPSVLLVTKAQLADINANPYRITDFYRDNHDFKAMKKDGYLKYQDKHFFGARINVEFTHYHEQYGHDNVAYVVPVRVDDEFTNTYVYHLVVAKYKLYLDDYQGRIIQCRGSKCRMSNSQIHCESCYGEIEYHNLEEQMPHTKYTIDDCNDIELRRNQETLTFTPETPEEFVEESLRLIDDNYNDEKAILSKLTVYNKTHKILDIGDKELTEDLLNWFDDEFERNKLDAYNKQVAAEKKQKYDAQVKALEDGITNMNASNVLILKQIDELQKRFASNKETSIRLTAELAALREVSLSGN